MFTHSEVTEARPLEDNALKQKVVPFTQTFYNTVVHKAVFLPNDRWQILQATKLSHRFEDSLLNFLEGFLLPHIV